VHARVIGRTRRKPSVRSVLALREDPQDQTFRDYKKAPGGPTNLSGHSCA